MRKRASQPIHYPLSSTNKLPKHYYTHSQQQSHAYSPALSQRRNNNQQQNTMNSSSPHTYTPSYSHQSSSPSPIGINSNYPQRRFSDNFANKKSVTHIHHGYLVNPPQQTQHEMNAHSHSHSHSLSHPHPHPNSPLKLSRS
eukprot:117907_1